MKLGELKAQIRLMKNAPTIPMVVGNALLWVKVQKVSLMEELDSIFSSKVDETGLMVKGDKVMPIPVGHGVLLPKAESVEPEAAEAEAEDDLLADDDADDLLA